MKISALVFGCISFGFWMQLELNRDRKGMHFPSNMGGLWFVGGVNFFARLIVAKDWASIPLGLLHPFCSENPPIFARGSEVVNNFYWGGNSVHFLLPYKSWPPEDKFVDRSGPKVIKQHDASTALSGMGAGRFLLIQIHQTLFGSVWEWGESMTSIYINLHV